MKNAFDVIEFLAFTLILGSPFYVLSIAVTRLAKAFENGITMRQNKAFDLRIAHTEPTKSEAIN
jgi:hypothetical protein